MNPHERASYGLVTIVDESRAHCASEEYIGAGADRSCKMPVSAALLVSGPSGQSGVGGGGQYAPVQSVTNRHQNIVHQNFTRGEKTSSSVRLRKRRDDLSQPGRKINRHSGDFSYFSPNRNEVSVKSSLETTSSNRSVDVGDGGVGVGGAENNWNYITFANGVACVQQCGVQEVTISDQRPPGTDHHPSGPVLVRMREAPGVVNQVKLRSNLNYNRSVSASVMNIQEQQQLQQHSQNPFRKSGDFSLFNDSPHNYKAPQSEIEDVNVRRRPHARSHSQQPIKTSNNNNNNTPPNSNQAPGHASTAYLHVTPGRQPAPSTGGKIKKEDNNVTKRCSGEFEFKRINRRSGDFHQLSHVLAQELDKAEEQSFVERMISRELYGDSGSEGSEESGIFSTGSSHESPRKETRKPGLGRRAITQVNMREKKNSYNHALAKSQENLVKVCKFTFFFILY